MLGGEERRIVLSADRGFTIVELLVGVALLAILLALGAPAMGTYLQNSKLASVTSVYFSALQAARSEAIRHNSATEFVLTNDAVTGADPANTVAPSTSGRNWLIRAAASAGGYLPMIDAGTAGEGQGAPGPAAVQVQVSASAPAVWTGVIPFNGFGATDGPYTIDITNPVAGSCAGSGGSVRCRRIMVSPGGRIAACDPAAAASTGDSRAC